MPCLGFFLPASTRGGVTAGTARGSRSTGLPRSGRHLATTRFTAAFSLDPLSCVDSLFLRIFDAPRGRRQHVHPRVATALARVTRPCTRSRATRRSPLGERACGAERYPFAVPILGFHHHGHGWPDGVPKAGQRGDHRSARAYCPERRSAGCVLPGIPIFPGHDGSRRAAPVGEVVNLRRGDIDLDVAGRLAICLRATQRARILLLSLSRRWSRSGNRCCADRCRGQCCQQRRDVLLLVSHGTPQPAVNASRQKCLARIGIELNWGRGVIDLDVAGRLAYRAGATAAKAAQAQRGSDWARQRQLVQRRSLPRRPPIPLSV